MQSLWEAVLGWWGEGEDGIIVLPLFEVGTGEVLCLIAFASSMGNGMTLNAVFWDMRSVRGIASVTKTKTDTAIQEWLFKW